MKETPKTTSLVKKKQRRKNASLESTFFFRSIPLQRKSHRGGKLRNKRDLSSNKQTTTQARGQKREENKTENHGTRGLLSLFFFAFGAFLFEGVVVWWKKEEEEQKKHQSSVDKDFSGFIIRTFKQH
jgi:hypothetical protein